MAALGSGCFVTFWLVVFWLLGSVLVASVLVGSGCLVVWAWSVLVASPSFLTVERSILVADGSSSALVVAATTAALPDAAPLFEPALATVLLPAPEPARAAALLPAAPL